MSEYNSHNPHPDYKPEDWQFADPNNLELYVQKVVNGEYDLTDMVSTTVHNFPEQLDSAFVWSRRHGRVQRLNKADNPYSSKPTYTELHVGCVECGLTRLDSFVYQGISTDELLLRKSRGAIRSRYGFHLNTIMSDITIARVNLRLTREQVGRLKDKSDEYRVLYSTLVIACIACGLATSGEWLPEHDEHPDAEEGWIDVFTASLQHFMGYMNRTDRI